MLKKYGGSAKVLFTDADSLMYEWKTEDFYKEENLILYETSDYPPTHFLHDSTNANFLWKFKDKCAGKPLLEFVGLRSKMYSILLSNKRTKSVVKGIKNRLCANKFAMNSFKTV